ncbi:Stomatin/HflK/HflC family like protein [Aduncisulcus paluster]|uniref:Stomatin/HflK/HflC family like protein n=1 Tax=Aduncisulcus paluster TaxID=2918883 RepID=A0ABQ5K159_9EUKA|nr:Stomatin/HflK/HflC family like protein [Aduncisulcus paluster]
MIILYIALAIVGFLILFSIFLCCSAKVVHQGTVLIVQRFGKYNRTAKPGLHWLIPFVEKPRHISWRYLVVASGYRGPETKIVSIEADYVDLREVIVDFRPQRVITKDNVMITIDALLMYQIKDPRRAVFKIQNLPDSLELLTQSNLRDIVALIPLDDTFSSREQINAMLMSRLSETCERWGVEISRVEIQNIFPPPDVKQAMQEQIKEERDRRSTVLKADGERQSLVIRSRGQAVKVVLDAEAFKRVEILKAEGKAEARAFVADAEAKSIEILRDVLAKHSTVKATEYLVALQYLQALTYLGVTAKDKIAVKMVPKAIVDVVKTINKATGLHPAT